MLSRKNSFNELEYNICVIDSFGVVNRSWHTFIIFFLASGVGLAHIYYFFSC
jgi:hypothetical protein